jgi:hypothetical protein
MMSPSKMAAVALCAVLTASGCAKLGYMSVQIDNVTFDVPRDYLVSGSIPWLPAAQSQALRFVVNPTAEVRDQHMVSIEPVSITCASAEAAATRTLSNACAAAGRGAEWPAIEGGVPLERISDGGSTTQWNYVQPSEGGDVLASCFLASESAGLCLSLGTYKHLVYSLRFSEAEIQTLKGMHEQVRALLRSWES